MFFRIFNNPFQKLVSKKEILAWIGCFGPFKTFKKGSGTRSWYTFSVNLFNRTFPYVIFHQLAYNLSQNIWDYIWCPCEIAHYERSVISAFQEPFANFNKILILAGRLGTRLSFCGILRLSWYFLIS